MIKETFTAQLIRRPPEGDAEPEADGASFEIRIGVREGFLWARGPEDQVFLLKLPIDDPPAADVHAPWKLEVAEGALRVHAPGIEPVVEEPDPLMASDWRSVEWIVDFADSGAEALERFIQALTDEGIVVQRGPGWLDQFPSV